MKRENDNYISLQEAARYCKYSQEYLGLRARQGKLKAVKFGRNWVTKKGWLEKYIAKVEEYRSHLTEKKVKKEVLPPENLPIGEFSEIFKVRPSPIRFGFLFGLALILIIAGGIFGRTFFPTVSEDISDLTGSIYISGVSVRDISKDVENILREYFQWLGATIKLLILSTGDMVSKLAWNFVCGMGQIGKYISQLFGRILK